MVKYLKFVTWLYNGGRLFSLRKDLCSWILSVLFFLSVSRAASPSPQSVRRVSSSRSVSGSPEPAAKKPPAPQSPVQSQSPSTNWSPAVPVKKAKSPTPSPSPARVCVCPVLDTLSNCMWSRGSKDTFLLFCGSEPHCFL